MGTMKGYALKQGYQQLRLGMTRDEVFSLFGTPDSQRIHNGVEILGWWSREFKGLLRGGSVERRVTVEFEYGRVVGFDGENVDASIW